MLYCLCFNAENSFDPAPHNETNPQGLYEFETHKKYDSLFSTLISELGSLK